MKILKILLVVIMLIGCQTQEPKEPEISSLSFVAVGDNIMHEQMIKNAKQENTYDFSPYYQNIKSYIQDADLELYRVLAPYIRAFISALTHLSTYF